MSYDAADRILGAAELRHKVGGGRSAESFKQWARRAEKRGEFPCRIRLSERVVGWSEKEVLAWLAAKLKRAA